MTFLPVNTQALASQNKIVFTVKKSTQFRCDWSVQGRIGKERAGPTQVFHASDPWPTTQQVGKMLMAVAVYNLGM